MTARRWLNAADYDELLRARDNARDWLLAHCKESPGVPVGPPAVLEGLFDDEGRPWNGPVPTAPKEQPRDPWLLVTIDRPLSEDPDSDIGLVRQLLHELLITLVEHDRPAALSRVRESSSKPQRRATADATWRLDLSKQKKAQKRLALHGYHVRAAAKLLVEQAQIRQRGRAVSPRFYGGDADQRLIALACGVERDVLELERCVELINNEKPLHNAAELIDFRRRWRKALGDVRLAPDVIESLLGEQAPTNRAERVKRNDRRRKRPKAPGKAKK